MTTGTRSEPTARQRHFLDVMLLMIAADGVVRDEELAQLAQSVSEHAVFDGVGLEQIEGELMRAFAALQADGFDARIEAIADGLGDYRAQLLAFALATRICFADGQLATEELSLLKIFQRAFGLQDDHVVEVVSAVGEGGDLDGLIEELWQAETQLSVAQAQIEVMLLMASADGEIIEDEAKHLALAIASQEEFSALSEVELSQAVVKALARIASDGLTTRLSALRRSLPSEDDRLRAILNAYVMLVADGVVQPGETECLLRMKEVFELSDESMRYALATATKA